MRIQKYLQRPSVSHHESSLPSWKSRGKLKKKRSIFRSKSASHLQQTNRQEGRRLSWILNGCSIMTRISSLYEMKQKGCCLPEKICTLLCIKTTVQFFQRNSACSGLSYFWRKKRQKQNPAVTITTEVIACFRKHLTTPQSCARVKRQQRRSHHQSVTLSKESAALPCGSTWTEGGHRPTAPVSGKLLVSWLLKPESWTVTKSWVQPHKKSGSAPQNLPLSNIHHVTLRLWESPFH